MSTSDARAIADALAEIAANEDDPDWEAWTRDRMRLQERIDELKTTNSRLATDLVRTRAAAGTLSRSDTQTATAPSRASAAWWTKREVADHLGISVRTLERMMEDSPPAVPVPWRKVGRSVRWSASKVDTWIDNINRLGRRSGRR